MNESDRRLWHKSAFYWFALRHRSEYHRALARERIARAKELRSPVLVHLREGDEL